MGYLAYILAFLSMLIFQDTSGMTSNQGIGVLLSTALGINQFFFYAYIVVCIFLIIMSLLGGVVRSATTASLSGCVLLGIVIFGVMQLIVWQLNLLMVNNWGPDGPTSSAFWVGLVLTVFLGIG